jgi:hypothetical protein
VDDHDKRRTGAERGEVPDRPMESDCWLPDVLFERWSRASPRPPLEATDLAELDDRCFVHALLPFPIDTGETFGLGLWLEVDRFTFRRVRRARANPAARPGLPVSGRIANDIQHFGTRLLGVRVRAEGRAGSPRPLVVEAFDRELAALMAHGWSGEQYRSVVRAAAEHEEGQGE